MKWNFKWRNICLSVMLAMLTVASQAHAKTLLQSLAFKPYIGIEYQYQHIKGNTTWTQFMPANMQYDGIFLGNKYHENFGIEIAYYHSIKKSQGSAFLDQFGNVPANGDTLILAQMQNKGFSVEWDIYYNLDKLLDKEFNVMALIGLVTMHPTINIYSNSGTNLSTAITTVHGKNATIFRLGAGAEFIQKNWGCRAKILWDHTEQLYVDNSNVGPTFTSITERAFKQAVGVTVGVFYIF